MNFWSFRRKRSLAQRVYERTPLPPTRHTVYFVSLRGFLERLHSLHAQRSMMISFKCPCCDVDYLKRSSARRQSRRCSASHGLSSCHPRAPPVRPLVVKRTALRRDSRSQTGNLRPRFAVSVLDFRRRSKRNKWTKSDLPRPRRRRYKRLIFS